MSTEVGDTDGLLRNLAAAPSAPPPKLAGTRIRHYELLRELGRGGMGQVFLARDTRLARRVALKFLTSSRTLTERFLAEARVTARCTHENIVVIHEVDEHEGTPYMVLEYLEGTTLRGLMDARVSPGRAVELMIPVVRALVCAHEFGIVHRDLKPENIFLTSNGAIKVLDFGIAKLLDDVGEPVAGGVSGELAITGTGHGTLIGTLPYMSPEQLGAGGIDHRSDLWAIGIMMYELVVGRHPLAPVTAATLMAQLSDLETPMPKAGALDGVIGRCLAKRKEARFASAAELLGELEALLPDRLGRRLSDDESPYPGLAAFDEQDANRFFGRDQEVARVTAKLREQPLVAIVGPSGVGKSSLVRAGVAPALKRGGEAWDVRVVRPGRAPLANLASIVDDSDPTLAARLAREPGTLGALLRARGTNILVFVDQFEELYTLGAAPDERRAFTSCLSGIADDASGPLRVVVTMRSDFLDRVAEHARFLDDVMRGLVFLQPLGKNGLRDALLRPAEALGYAFESGTIPDQMIDALVATPGALPLLQFAASRLWDTRDRTRKLFTDAAHRAMGGVEGVLAMHADDVIAGLTPATQRLARTVLQRLVTPERTRAIVETSELRGLGDAAAIDSIIDHLVRARLLVAHRDDAIAGTNVEIVHESLIRGWPALARWLDEDHENAAFLAQLRTAAKQWDQKDRAPGLLWRGEQEREARQFRARYRGELVARERAYLDGVLQLGSRSARIRRAVYAGSIALLAVIAAASAIALYLINDARGQAEAQAERAHVEEQHAKVQEQEAKQQAARAVAAENSEHKELDELKTEQERRARAEGDALQKTQQVEESREDLKREVVVANQARATAEEAKRLAEEAAAKEKATREQAEKLYQDELRRNQEAAARSKQITTTLAK